MDKNIPFYIGLEKGTPFDAQNYREKVSLEDIAEIEKKYNSKLPNEYKKFLVDYNSAFIGIYKENDKYFYPVNKYLEDKYFDIPTFYSIDDIDNMIQHDIKYSSEDERYLYKELFEMGLFPIGCDSGFYHELLIGTVKENFGKIYFYEINFLESIEYICDSFNQFIEAYYFKEDTD